MNSPANDDGDVLDSRRYKIAQLAVAALVFLYLILLLAGRWIGPGTKAILLVAGYIVMCALALWFFHLYRRYAQSRFFLRGTLICTLFFPMGYLLQLLDLTRTTHTVPPFVAVIWVLLVLHFIIALPAIVLYIRDELRSFW
jgi:hypothetical protein